MLRNYFITFVLLIILVITSGWLFLPSYVDQKVKQAVNADGTGQKNLTPTRRLTEEWNPAFSVDGDRIIFVVRRGNDDKTDEIFVMNKDGNGLKQLTNNLLVDWYPSINPKTGRIIFVSREPNETTDDIYVMEENGTNRGRIISLRGNDADPAWDATGEKIIFIRENETNYDLYMMNEDASDLTIMTTDKDELSPIFMSAN